MSHRSNNTGPSRPYSEEATALSALQQLDLRLRGYTSSRDLSSNHSASETQNKSTHPDDRSSSLNDDNNEVNLRDLTGMAVWMVSTAKPGNGIEQILDGDRQTYWQSDGPQPHYISAQFISKLKISEIHIYLRLEVDESYTPSVISVRAGSNFHDLRTVISRKKLRNPHGWIRIPLGEDAEESDGEMDDESDTDPNAEPSADQSARKLRKEQRQQEKKRLMEERRKQKEMSRKIAQSGVNGHLEVLRDRQVIKAHMIQIIIHANHHKGRDSHVRMVKVLGPKQQVTVSGNCFTTKEFQMYETIR